MRLLLDTQILLWAVAKSSRLTPTIRELLEDTANDIMFSAASIWEIAFKTALGKPEFDIRPERIANAARATGLVELPVSAEAAARVADLPLHHREPLTACSWLRPSMDRCGSTPPTRYLVDIPNSFI